MALERLVLVTVALAAWTIAIPTRADDPPTRPGAGSVLDRVIGERAAARRIHREARARLLTALQPERDDALGPADETLLEQAIARYDAVLLTFPNDVDAWLERAHALAAFHRTLPDGRVERRSEDAIASLRRARALDPAREARWVAYEMAALHADLGAYAASSEEYARALEADRPDVSALEYDVSRAEAVLVYLFVVPLPTTMLSNWAEAAMLDGRIDDAMTLYRRAADAAPPGSEQFALALWGLAVAEERAGHHGEALSSATRAIASDPMRHDTARGAAIAMRHGVLAVLHLPNVRFAPAYEIHAYEAIGHEALAERAANEEARASERAAALRSYRYFLAEGGRASSYAAAAERAEARLGRPSERRGP